MDEEGVAADSQLARLARYLESEGITIEQNRAERVEMMKQDLTNPTFAANMAATKADAERVGGDTLRAYRLLFGVLWGEDVVMMTEEVAVEMGRTPGEVRALLAAAHR